MSTNNSSSKRVRFANVPPPTPPPSSRSSSGMSSHILPYALYLPALAQLPASVQREFAHVPCTGVPSVPRMHPPTRPRAPPPTLPRAYITLHPLLRAPSHPAFLPPLSWDVAMHPSAIRVGGGGLLPGWPLTPYELASPAIQMSIDGGPILYPQMLLVFSGLPLRINIQLANRPVSVSNPRPYLTVGDVLYGLYMLLRRSVDPRQFALLEQAHRQAITRVFHTRLTREWMHYWHNVYHGVRGIDYLGVMRVFVGLRPAVGSEVPLGRQAGEVYVVVLRRQ